MQTDRISLMFNVCGFNFQIDVNFSFCTHLKFLLKRNCFYYWWRVIEYWFHVYNLFVSSEFYFLLLVLKNWTCLIYVLHRVYSSLKFIHFFFHLLVLRFNLDIIPKTLDYSEWIGVQFQFYKIINRYWILKSFP